MKERKLSAAADGLAQRKKTPRRQLCEWTSTLRKRDPLVLLEEACRSRLPNLLAIKNQRMSASAFAYFRGAAPVMAYDLSLAPSTELNVQLCGDAHVQNLGAYTGPDGRLTFDINDFDETIRGPFEFDVKRLATSILLAGAQAGVATRDAHAAAEAFLRAYVDLLRELSDLPLLEVARFQVHRLKSAAPVARILRKADRAAPAHSLAKLTVKARGTRHFRDTPPLLFRVTGKEREAVLASLELYTQSLLPERRHILSLYTPADVGFKVVGTGSVGTRDYCVLLFGNGTRDPLFLQIKEESTSAWAPYLSAHAAPQRHQGQRVAEGQRAMQLQTDPMLGWTRIQGRDFLVRQLNDHKAALDVTNLDARGLREYSSVCGELLARGHARSSDPRMLAAYIGAGPRFTDAILSFAKTYAAQTAADFQIFLAHVSPESTSKSADK